MVAVNMISGESNEGASGAKVEGSESKSLAENPIDKGVLSEGVKVSGDSTVLDGESITKNVINSAGKGSVESGRLIIKDKYAALSKNRIVEVRSQSSRWDSWGVMNMVGRVLGGKFSMDDEVDDSDTSEIGCEADKDTWKGVIGEPASLIKREVKGIALEDVSTSEIGHEADVVVDKDACRGVIGELKSVKKIDVERIVIEKVTLDDVKTSKIGRETDVVVDKGACLGLVREPSVNKIDFERTGVEKVALEDVNTSKFGYVAGLVADKDACQGVNRGPTSVNKSDIKRIVADKDLDDLVEEVSPNGERDLVGLVEGNALNGKKDCDGLVEETSLNEEEDPVDLVKRTCIDREKDLDNLVEGTGLKEAQDSTFNELVPDGLMEIDEVIDFEVDTYLVPKKRGEYQNTKKVGEYFVSDLVWGKVKSHPWWPGQIFPPISASDKAAKHIRKQSYLIAYFGDQSFAWNVGANIKPFRMNFSQMEKQSNSDGFCHAVSCALDEVARRVEFGLLCPCVTEEVHDKIKLHVVSNAGIREEENAIYGGDHLSAADSFLPGRLLQFLESAAECPQSKTNRLQFTLAKAQLVAFNRWKGHYELPVFEQYFGLLEDDSQVTVKEDEEIDSSSRKRNPTALDGPSTKRRHLSDDIEFPTLKEKPISSLMSSSASIFPCLVEKPLKRARRRGRPISSGKNSEGNNTEVSNSKVKRQKGLLPASPVGDGYSDELELVEIIPTEISTPDLILSKIFFSAKVPMQGLSIMITEIGFLREFRNLICLEKKSKSGSPKMDFGNDKGKQPEKLKIVSNTSGLEGDGDSYWTGKIVQGYSQKQVLLEPKSPTDKDVQVKEAGIKEKDVFMNLDSEKTLDESQPTALILNFTNLDSIPPVPNLNEIFSRYGPLKESETKILCKSKRVKVIFKRRADAETAFSSSGKYSIFGPSLQSYRLHYEPTPRKSGGSSKRNKKGSSSKADA